MSAAPAGSWAGELLRSLATDAVKRAALALGAAVLPPAAVVFSRGKEFAIAWHAVPGWAILVAASLAGLLCFSVGANVVQYQRARRRTLAIVPEGNVYSLNWSVGSRQTEAGSVPVMQVWGDFQVTNLTDRAVAVPRTILVAWGRGWRIFPYRIRVVGPGVYRALPAKTSRVERMLWWTEPPIRATGKTLRAKAGLVDHLDRTNWTPWLRWPFMGGG